ncbi:PqqD family protein [Sulfurovum sp. zt1-1]|uniref:PqqD family protein n=1 Tax=Sulfurovum zhangzhouensis TaxID=3019067 RepID=A0ABT7QWY6_9BACT|nr:PqqD family protein [Sulfurovum zhangzhouensis]MDM5271355.1 PqqD family protein [Sulfurovum zhangzhouensis]
MNLNQQIVFADTVFAQEVDGEMVLLDMNSENYFGLDSVGMDFWKAIEEKKNLKDVLETLMAQYDVEEEVLKSDLFTFVEKLQKSGLVEVKVV